MKMIMRRYSHLHLIAEVTKCEDRPLKIESKPRRRKAKDQPPVSLQSIESCEGKFYFRF